MYIGCMNYAGQKRLASKDNWTHKPLHTWLEFELYLNVVYEAKPTKNLSTRILELFY